MPPKFVDINLQRQFAIDEISFFFFFVLAKIVSIFSSTSYLAFFTQISVHR